jgi:UDP-N-acetylmuramyl pentapeptide synthase
MLFHELVSICQGRLLQFPADRLVETLVIDSRKAVVTESSLFFAIKGDRHDGHRYLEELYRLGLRQFIVESEINPPSYPDANILKVTSSLAALQAIAMHHRSQFSIPVVGITGSNGKTIVKEWLDQVLSPDFQIVRNPGSYNSQVGVPLSVWQIRSHHEMGIFEAGVSRPGEMEKLQAIIRPAIGIFTNLGSAHDEGFSSRYEKAEEKVRLFTHCERVIYCRDHTLIHETLQSKNIPSLTWG